MSLVIGSRIAVSIYVRFKMARNELVRCYSSAKFSTNSFKYKSF